MFEEFIIWKAFYRVYAINVFDDVYDILLYFLSGYNNIRLIFLIFGLGFYRPKGLITAEDTMFKVEYWYVLQYESVVYIRFRTN